ncbi:MULTISPECIES: hypothetical protein [Nocardioides]|uniref:Uncharacterized protein n=1 Tax=Nocardioides vastitatis TaxID=2568655 RepID=A0ABW0ZCR8_9ACTN|nr:hypothetical protein [Nocardioides sp.]THJ05339.1 hypothetical protein E7Z54_07605 [Nocardioides sp.]
MGSIRRNAALIAAAAVVGSLGIGGVMAAQADSNTHAPASSSVVQSGSNGAEEKADGPDQGPDANPNEPGHQDADESGEAEGAAETADGPDQGVDANPHLPGHQDANESGEAN